MTTYLKLKAAEMEAVETLLSLQAGEFVPFNTGNASPAVTTSNIKMDTVIRSQVTNISKKKIFLSKWNDTVGVNSSVSTKDVIMSHMEAQTDIEHDFEITTIVLNEKRVLQLKTENKHLKIELKQCEEANSSVMESSIEQLSVSRTNTSNTPLTRKTRRKPLVDYKALNDNLDSSDSEGHKYSRGNTSKKLKTYTTTNSDMVKLGEGNATVPTRLFKNIDWGCHSNATRKLLTAVFSRQVLATHSLTGKRSPAFPNKPAKRKLNAVLVNDIVQTVVDKCRVPENLVRTSITTKCADESKMLRTRQLKKKTFKENTPPSDDSDEFEMSR